MASGKRQPSKQKRSSQNKQQRAALQVRKAAANAAPSPAASQAKKPRRWGRAAQSARTAPPAAASTAPEPEHDEPEYDDDPVAVTEVEVADEAAEAEPMAVDDAPAVDEAAAPAAPEPAPTTLLGRLRRPEEVNLPRAATGALNIPISTAKPAAAPTPAPQPAAPSSSRPAPAATSRTTPRPTTVREAAASGKARAERRSNAQARAALQPPGYRAALTGLLLGFAAVLLVAISAVPVNHAGDLYTTDRLVAQWAVPALHAAQHTASTSPAAVVKAIGAKDWETGRHVKRVLSAEWPISLAILLPLLGAYLTFRSVRQRRTARIVTRSVYITMLGALISINIYSAFFPVLITVICVTVASYQVRKAETAAAAAAAGAGVIDADVVE